MDFMHLQSVEDSLKRSEDRNHDSEKAKKVLEKTCSTLEHQNIVGEAKYDRLIKDMAQLEVELNIKLFPDIARDPANIKLFSE